MRRPGVSSRNSSLTLSAERVMRATRQLIHGRIVNLSVARTALIARWESVRPLVSPAVKRKPGYAYELPKRFYTLFLKRLEKVVIQYSGKSNMTSADLLAVALLRAAVPFETYKALRGESRMRNLLERLVRFPLKKKTTFEYADDSQGEPSTAKQSMSGKIQLRADAGRGKKAREILYLRVRGKPVKALTGAFFCPTGSLDRRRARYETKRVLRAVCNELAKMIGAVQVERGRPTEARLREAAYLRETFGFSWRQIAEALCPEGHQHTAACRERFRKGVPQLRKH